MGKMEESVVPVTSFMLIVEFSRYIGRLRQTAKVFITYTSSASRAISR